MSETVKHNLFRATLYGGIFLIILYFFNGFMDSNKKITYINKERFKPELITKATILDGDKNLLVETKENQLFIIEDFDKAALERSGISYGHENKTIDTAIKYVLSVVLFVFVMLLAIT